jgi:hypothetical protein
MDGSVSLAQDGNTNKLATITFSIELFLAADNDMPQLNLDTQNALGAPLIIIAGQQQQ